MSKAVPETTSAEAFERYVGGKCLRAGHGEAWRDIKARIIALPRIVDALHLPAVSEPFLAWTVSGEAEFQEREGKRPWVTHRLKKGSFFLTSGGAPYDCRWKALTAEPFESMAVFIELPLLQRALEEVFGEDAINARLKDISAFTDAALNSLMERLHEELMRRQCLLGGRSQGHPQWCGLLRDETRRPSLVRRAARGSEALQHPHDNHFTGRGGDGTAGQHHRARHCRWNQQVLQGDRDSCRLIRADSRLRDEPAGGRGHKRNSVPTHESGVVKTNNNETKRIL